MRDGLKDLCTIRSSGSRFAKRANKSSKRHFYACASIPMQIGMPAEAYSDLPRSIEHPGSCADANTDTGQTAGLTFSFSFFSKP